MFKLVVLCAFLAAAAANPDLYAIPQASIPLAWAPSYTRTASSVISHPTSLVYSSPLTYTHLIKKRSPQLPWTYLSPTTYLTGSPLSTTYSSNLIHGGQFVSTYPTSAYTTAHLIKKRSAAFLPNAYVGSHSYGAPLITSYAASTPLFSSHLIPQQLTYTQFIKK